MNPADLVQIIYIFLSKNSTALEVVDWKVDKITHENTPYFTCTFTLIPVSSLYILTNSNLLKKKLKNNYIEGISVCIINQSDEKETFTLHLLL